MRVRPASRTMSPAGPLSSRVTRRTTSSCVVCSTADSRSGVRICRWKNTRKQCEMCDLELLVGFAVAAVAHAEEDGDCSDHDECGGGSTGDLGNVHAAADTGQAATTEVRS